MNRSIDSKPTRTSNNKPPKSGVIRKGSMPIQEVEQMAKQLTNVVEVVEAPEIEPEGKIVKKMYCRVEMLEKGDYGVYAALIKAHCAVHETYEASIEELLKVFPQNKRVADIARNLKRSHGLSYRLTDHNSYIFFVEPTREELIVQLTSAESKVIELKSQNREIYTESNDLISLYQESKNKLQEENTQLKSDLYNAKFKVVILFILVIILFICNIYTNGIWQVSP